MKKAKEVYVYRTYKKMKFRQVIITASVALSFLIGTTPTITAAPQRRRRRRSLESKNSQASVTATQRSKQYNCKELQPLEKYYYIAIVYFCR